MVAQLIFMPYFALISMVVVPFVFLGAVHMDYYHLPSNPENSLCELCSNYLVARHRYSSEGSGKFSVSDAVRMVYGLSPKRLEPWHEEKNVLKGYLRIPCCCTSERRNYWLVADSYQSNIQKDSIRTCIAAVNLDKFGKLSTGSMFSSSNSETHT